MGKLEIMWIWVLYVYLIQLWIWDTYLVHLLDYDKTTNPIMVVSILGSQFTVGQLMSKVLKSAGGEPSRLLELILTNNVKIA